MRRIWQLILKWFGRSSRVANDIAKDYAVPQTRPWESTPVRKNATVGGFVAKYSDVWYEGLLYPQVTSSTSILQLNDADQTSRFTTDSSVLQVESTGGLFVGYRLNNNLLIADE